MVTGCGNNKDYSGYHTVNKETIVVNEYILFLNEAIIIRDTEKIKELLKQKKNINDFAFKLNVQEPMDSTQNLPPLSTACEWGNLDAVKMLIKKKADPNIKDKIYKEPPLFYILASIYSDNKYEIIKLLLENGAI